MSVSDQDRAGDLLIQEVDEELRHEQYAKLWKRYGHWAISAAVAVVVIVAGYQGWQNWDKSQREQEAVALQSAQALATQGKTQEASEALAKLAADAHGGVAVQAQMTRAQMFQQAGDVPGAIAAYDLLAKSSAPALYRDLAVIKASLLALEAGDASAYEAKLAEIAAPANSWHAQATELLAMVAVKKGDLTKAIELYKKLSDDAGTPEGMRGRATQMLAALNQAQAAAKVKG
ncbi:MAG TPA: tetratricopeptide repeat protein [Candidatus Sulfotelmatobacter sp.]|nr:tetratricopeptide repeat protein [Candidatus Sulfotelmatobacter sp.]